MSNKISSLKGMFFHDRVLQQPEYKSVSYTTFWLPIEYMRLELKYITATEV